MWLLGICPKNSNLARLHYQVSTNIGLIQGCMTYLFTKCGPRYHWILDILADVPSCCSESSIHLAEAGFFDIQSQKTNAAKAKRKLYTRKRKVFEHQRRQLFVKESAMKHDYGGDPSTNEVIADASTDKCKCGSTDHRKRVDKSGQTANLLFSDDESIKCPVFIDFELLEFG